MIFCRCKTVAVVVQGRLQYRYRAACQVLEAYVFQLRSKILAAIVEYTEYFY